jgi:hypothetical protein
MTGVPAFCLAGISDKFFSVDIEAFGEPVEVFSPDLSKNF